MEIERNPQNLWSKDSLGRNLLFIGAIKGYIGICEYLINKGIYVNEIHKTGCTALHAAAYCGHLKVVQLLLDYGAKTDLRNNFGYLPIDKAVSKEIKELLKKSENDSILKLHQYLVSKKLATKLIQIYSNGNIIARKIICKLNNLPKKYKSLNIINEWVPAWHGTKFQYLKSIVELGLKPPGEKSRNGQEIKVNESHIKREVTVNNINDWAQGIFVSPSSSNIVTTRNKNALNQNYKYNKETYESLPLLEKLIIKNRINKIISSYKIFIKRKNVSNYVNYTNKY